MITYDEVMPIGTITKARGLRGEMEMEVDYDVFEQGDTSNVPYFVLQIDDILVPFFWEEYRWKNDHTLIVQLQDVTSQEKARRLTGVRVYWPLSALSTEEGEQTPTLTSYRALKGFDVYDETDRLIGNIIQVDDTSSNILLYIHTPQQTEVIVPYHDDFLLRFSIQGRSLTLALPDGLLSLSE